MHDTFLNERLYKALVRLCEENRIVRLNRVNIAVHFDSHISENSLRGYFSDRNNSLLGEWTQIIVEKQNMGTLNAVINSIEGEQSDE